MNYDEQTARESDSEAHNPVMMPKITLDNEEEDDSNNDNNKHNKGAGNLMVPPAQNIEPPAED